MVLVSFQKMLSPVQLEALRATRFGDVRWVAEIDSTNRRVLELARDGEPEGVVVVADHQTAGRGRLGRSWQAPAGASLLVSVLLRPPLPVEQAHLVTMAAGVAAVDACAAVAGVTPGLKWPNDLVVDGGGDVDGGASPRKLAGLLAESVVTGRRLDALVVGMGLNVCWPEVLPPDLAGIATALNHLAGGVVDRGELLVAWLRQLDRRYGVLCQPEGWRPLLDDYITRSATLGRRVRVELAAGSFEGDAVAVGRDGHLVVQTDDGDRRPVAAGDVVHLRPTP